MNVSGGVQGGASAFSGLSDVAISSPSTGQVPVYNSGTSKWENGAVSATDSTKLPKDGSSSMSGPVVFGADSSTTSANYEIVRISNKLVRNAPSGKAISDRINGVEMLSLDGNGDTFALGRVDDGYNYVVGAYGSNFYNCPTSGSHVFRVQGAVVGHFPLTPSDMPTQYALEAVASSQTLNTSDYKTILYGTPGVNTGPAWSYSGGTWTCLIAGVYDIDAVIYAASSVVVELYVNKNGTRRYGGSAVICSSAPSVRKTISFGSGDTFYIEAYAAGTGPALDVSIVGLRDIFVNRRA